MNLDLEEVEEVEEVEEALAQNTSEDQPRSSLRSKHLRVSVFHIPSRANMAGQGELPGPRRLKTHVILSCNVTTYLLVEKSKF